MRALYREAGRLGPRLTHFLTEASPAEDGGSEWDCDWLSTRHAILCGLKDRAELNGRVVLPNPDSLASSRGDPEARCKVLLLPPHFACDLLVRCACDSCIGCQSRGGEQLRVRRRNMHTLTLGPWQREVKHFLSVEVTEVKSFLPRFWEAWKQSLPHS